MRHSGDYPFPCPPCPPEASWLNWLAVNWPIGPDMPEMPDIPDIWPIGPPGGCIPRLRNKAAWFRKLRISGLSIFKSIILNEGKQSNYFCTPWKMSWVLSISSEKLLPFLHCLKISSIFHKSESGTGFWTLPTFRRFFWTSWTVNSFQFTWVLSNILLKSQAFWYLINLSLQLLACPESYLFSTSNPLKYNVFQANHTVALESTDINQHCVSTDLFKKCYTLIKFCSLNKQNHRLPVARTMLINNDDFHPKYSISWKMLSSEKVDNEVY